MHERFYICGPPRSGSAWLSVLLSYGNDSYCYHEGERDLIHRPVEHQQDVMLDRMTSRREWHVGNASSGMLFWGQFSDAPLVIVHRDWDEVEESMDVAFQVWGRDDLRGMDFGLVKAAHQNVCTMNPDALHIEFEELFKVPTLEKIWSLCLPSVFPAPRDRFEDLLRMKIVLKEFDYPAMDLPSTETTTLTFV